VSVSSSVITGALASVGRTILLTLFLTSLTISFEFAQVFSVKIIDENQSEELEVTVSSHFISLISLYILSVIKLSISFGFVQGYTVDIEIIQNAIEGLDSFGIFIRDIVHITIITKIAK
jgi:uncharacterized membrane protein